MITLQTIDADGESKKLCDNIGLTFKPRSASSFDFMHNNEKRNLFGYILEIQNIFVLLNSSSIRGVIIQNI